MAKTIGEVLLDEVSNYLDITWTQSDAEKSKLKGQIDRAAASIRGKLGYCDFIGNTQEKGLLFIMVMYDRAGRVDEFWTNYRGEILSLQVRKRVEREEAIRNASQD